MSIDEEADMTPALSPPRVARLGTRTSIVAIECVTRP